MRGRERLLKLDFEMMYKVFSTSVLPGHEECDDARKNAQESVARHPDVLGRYDCLAGRVPRIVELCNIGPYEMCAECEPRYIALHEGMRKDALRDLSKYIRVKL
ncbi:hypothetical protein EIP91_004566 [Steccherinum ochraceum]|uniref:Uncharacterized protein n=1 Tax=Steccherinum ochraceum TaxID=92696 RepID=A0A4R0RJU9_9APHY|nr:hypothetical protein EIP91_004566 [Steccherinum ochraceum]